jgi:transposase
MSRQYQRTQMLLPQIKEMLEKGMSHREIEKRLGLSGDRPVHNLLKRERKKRITRCSQTPRSQTRKDTAGVQIREQATKDGK